MRIAEGVVFLAVIWFVSLWLVERVVLRCVRDPGPSRAEIRDTIREAEELLRKS